MNDVIRRLEEIGVAREKLNVIMEDDIWLDLSKHNAYWHSNDDKLNDVRMKLSYIGDKLWEIRSILYGEEE